ncbi:MAG: porin [Thermodesulfobacteriota bacterium]
MKKRVGVFLLAMALAFVLTAPVLAASKVDFSGTFRVRAFYLNNLTLNPKAQWESKQSFLDERLRIDFKIMPTENLTLNVGLTTEDLTWGRQGTGQFANRPYGNATVPSSKTGFEIRYAWLTVKTPFGQFDVGRMMGDMAGLANLGWFGSELAYAGFLDDTDLNSRDRISWTYGAGNFTLNAFYEKKHEADSGTGAAALNANRKYDQDWDSIAVTPTFKFANGGVSLTLAYDRMHSQFADLAGNTAMAALLANTAAGFGGFINSDIDGYLWSINPAAVLQFGPFGLHTELKYQTGQLKWRNVWNAPSRAATAAGNQDEVKSEAELSGFAFYIDATYNYGPGLVGLEYAYLSGDKAATDYKITNIITAGWDFCPFLIVYDRALAWTDHDNATFNPTPVTNISDGANHWMIGAWWDHAVMEDLKLHAALGYFEVIEAGRNFFTNREVKKSYGTEFDVSVLYTLMSNLTLQVDLGYFWPGDYWKQGWDNEQEIRNAGGNKYQIESWSKAGNAYALKTTLTLSF